MYDFVIIMRSILLLFIDFLDMAMLARMILSLFALEGKLAAFFYYVTEPIIMPVRAVFNRFGWAQDSPLDIPFLVTTVLLLLLYMFVSFL